MNAPGQHVGGGQGENGRQSERNVERNFRAGEGRGAGGGGDWGGWGAGGKRYEFPDVLTP